jgi:hypothetical protein
LRKGLAVGYWQAPEGERLEGLADRGLQAVAKLQRYLRSPQAKLNAERRYRKPPNGSNDPNVTNGAND